MASGEWPEALEAVVGRTRHERYRVLCAEDNPDLEQRDAYRALVVRTAAGEDPAAQVPAPDPATAALQAHVARHGCCSGLSL